LNGGALNSGASKLLIRPVRGAAITCQLSAPTTLDK
jgi:hypothetical protein